MKLRLELFSKLPDPKQVENIKNVVKSTLRAYKLKPSSWLGGLCAPVTVEVWNELGQPELLYPYSVMVGEEEHVILFNKQEDFAIDPTGSQFGFPLVAYNVSLNRKYTQRKRLTKRELKAAIEDGKAYKQNLQRKK